MYFMPDINVVLQQDSIKNRNVPETTIAKKAIDTPDSCKYRKCNYRKEGKADI